MQLSGENNPAKGNSCSEGLKLIQVTCSGIMGCSSPLNLDGRSSGRQSHRELGQAVSDRQRLAFISDEGGGWECFELASQFSY